MTGSCWWQYNNFVWFCQVGLFLSLGSCFAITKIWNDGLTISQAGFLSSCLVVARFKTIDWLQLTYSSRRSFIKQKVDSTHLKFGSGLTRKELPWSVLASLFILPVSSSWFCSVQNANGHTLKASQGRGMSGHMQNRAFTYLWGLAWTESFDWQLQVT